MRKRQDDPEDIALETADCRTLKYMAGFLLDAVVMELCENEAINRNPEWKALADKAHDALFELHEAIGKE